MHQTSDTDIVTICLRIADAAERTPDSQTQELLEQITEATERTNQYLGNDEIINAQFLARFLVFVMIWSWKIGD